MDMVLTARQSNDEYKVSDRGRKQLEEQAQETVCPCWYHALMQEINSADSIVLEKIVADPQYLHKAEYYNQPIEEKPDVEAAECPWINNN